MSQINVDRVKNREGTGSPTFTNGIVVSGVGTISSQVSIAGTLTYEDVTEIDSVGLITARTGVNVTDGGINVTAGGINVTAGGITVQAGIATLPANSTIGGKSLLLQEKQLPWQWYLDK